MRTKNLIPNSWRSFGWALIIVVVLLHVWGLVMVDNNTLQFGFKVQLPFNFGGFDSRDGKLIMIDGKLELMADEILSLLMIAGLLIVGFSRLKVEDERIAQIRLESLQWGIYANYLTLSLCILFVYGGLFFTVMTYSMFTPLIIFLMRFYWLLLARPILDAKRERNLS